jgi:ubiquinone/menaquinone biosynthesis C-methylase UbiE
MVIDSSELMIRKNVARPRKDALLCDAAELGARGETFDLIFCNFVLHHLVTTGSYRRTRENVERVLAGLTGSLSESGYISVYELEFNGAIDDFPGHAIFALTSSKLLAPVVKRLGGNTAGVGACFRSHRAWMKLFHGIGLNVVNRTRSAITTFPEVSNGAFC